MVAWWQQPQPVYDINVQDYGAVGDGVTDDAAAIQSAVTAAAADVGSVFFPRTSGGYRVTTTIALPSDVTLTSDGAVIFNANSVSAFAPVLSISNASNVTIHGLIIDGRKTDYTPTAEHRHGIKVSNSDNVTIVDVRSIDNKGDGIYVGDNIDGGSSAIKLDRVTCDGNHRNGLSITAVSGFTATSCRFTNTTGTSPQTGVDIEPNADTDVIEDLTFGGCVFSGNAGRGLLVFLRATPSARQAGINLVGCAFVSNTSNGIELNNAREVRVVGGDASFNAGRGVAFLTVTAGRVEDVSFVATTIESNQFQGVVVLQPFDRVSFVDVRVRNNGLETVGVWTGLDISPTSASTDLRVIGVSSGGSSQSNGIRTNTNVSLATHSGNRYVGNTVATVSLADQLASRVRSDVEALTIPGVLDHDGTTVGFYGTTPVAKPSGVTARAALEALGLGVGLIAG